MVVQVRRELLLSFGGLALAASVMAGTAIWAQSRAADELNTFMQGLNRRGQTATALELAGRNRALEVRNALLDRKSTRLNSSHSQQSRMPSSA